MQANFIKKRLFPVNKSHPILFSGPIFSSIYPSALFSSRSLARSEVSRLDWVV